MPTACATRSCNACTLRSRLRNFNTYSRACKNNIPLQARPFLCPGIPVQDLPMLQ